MCFNWDDFINEVKRNYDYHLHGFKNFAYVITVISHWYEIPKSGVSGFILV